ncbi:MAG: hypothetical protein ACD_4C00192G0003 [uncultured bacterium (gcode 4)]|uniref:Uncharacterized protein n=1 Tax=uncultured bacterium (gcode 4) TaxID=1234023 RepID=K2GTM4_9BACT|nr:MAG: hypothetical protein ACD_4C00192G0003 [uncultured bacterium (gcode 4)]
MKRNKLTEELLWKKVTFTPMANNKLKCNVCWDAVNKWRTDAHRSIHERLNVPKFSSIIEKTNSQINFVLDEMKKVAWRSAGRNHFNNILWDTWVWNIIEKIRNRMKKFTQTERSQIIWYEEMENFKSEPKWLPKINSRTWWSR